MSYLLVLLIVLILLAAFVPQMHANLRLGLWIAAALCLVLLMLQVLGVALPWQAPPLVR